MPFAAFIPLISAAVQAIGQHVANRQAQKRQIKQQTAANKELAQYQYDKDLETWNRQNKYNSPASQMSRYQEAGLNPNLIYGQGNSGNSTSTPHYNQQSVEQVHSPFQLPNMLEEYQNFEAKQANIHLQQENARLINEKVRSEAVNRMVKALQGDKTKQDLVINQELHRYNREIREQEAQQAIQKTKLGGYELSGADFRLGILKEQAAQAGYTTEIKKGEAGRQGLQKEIMTNQLEQKKLDLLYKRYEESFRKMGLAPGDNLKLRLILRMSESLGIDIGDLLNNPNLVSDIKSKYLKRESQDDQYERLKSEGKIRPTPWYKKGQRKY